MSEPKIWYPVKYSEFEIQAELYHQLRIRDVEVRGSVPARCFEFNKQPFVFFDLVVFNLLKLPVVIIECKNHSENSPPHVLNGRQKRRYEQFNIPILLCDRVSRIEPVIQEIEAMMQEAVFA